MGHKKSLIFREKQSGHEKDYEFTPLQSIIAIKIMQNIEFGLVALFKIELHQEMTLLTLEGNKPIATNFDGLQYISYPLEKRAEIYKKYPEIDSLLFGKFDFMEYIAWIMEKKNESEHMEKYCNAVEKIVSKILKVEG